MKEVLTNFYYLCPRKILLDHKFNKFVNKTLTRNTMKKFAYLFAVISIACMFTACSSDDDPAIPGAGLPESKTYTATEGLSLQLDGANALGQEVSFERTQDSKANITIKGAQLDISSLLGGIGGKADATTGLTLPTASVIPGSTQVTIPVDLTGDANNCSFSGNSETEYCTFAYAGKVSTDALFLSITDVKLKNTSLAGTYNLLADAPLRIVWDGSEFTFGPEGEQNEWDLCSLIQMMTDFPIIDFNGEPTAISNILGKILKSVTFGEDGSITAVYADTEKAGLPEAIAPKGLASYVVTGNNTIRVFLYPEAIIAATNASKASDAQAEESPAFDPTIILSKINIDGLLKKVVPMLSGGVPLHYGEVVNDAVEKDTKNISFYLGKETLLPILQDIAPVCEDAELRKQLIDFVSAQAGDMAPLAVMFMGPALEAFPNIVNNTTTELQIGLNLKKQ